MPKKKVINVDVLAQGWMQVFPTLYAAVRNDYAQRINEEAEFIFEGKPKIVDTLVANVTMIVKDKRWQWPKDRVPYDILVTVPHDRAWIGTIDAGPQWKNKRRVDEIIANDKTFRGRIDKVLLRPTFEHSGIDQYGYVNAQPHVVLAFQDEEDYVYWKMKYE